MASALASLLRRLAAVALVVLLCVGFISPAEAKGKAAKTISPEDMAAIRKQAEEFMEAKDRLPELATLVNERDWVFTRNLIRGPMQPLGREMLYINQRLLPKTARKPTSAQLSSKQLWLSSMKQPPAGWLPPDQGIQPGGERLWCLRRDDPR